MNLDDYLEIILLLDDCFNFLKENGIITYRYEFCQKFLRRSTLYCAKIRPDRIPSLAVWVSLFVALNKYKGKMGDASKEAYLASLVKQVWNQVYTRL